MGGYVLGVFLSSRNWWLASIRTTIIYLCFCTLSKGVCCDTDPSYENINVAELLKPENITNSDALITELDKIEKKFESSQDPLKEIRLIKLMLDMD
jgi:hypothetical protein